MANAPRKMTRREFVPQAVRGAGLVVVGGVLGSLASRPEAEEMVWQIDPKKCVACENCATACVVNPSAVKCVHEHAFCGYCNLCFAYLAEQRPDNVMAAENVRCPTDAIGRRFVEEPYYQYVIDETKCIGCGICVKGCVEYGNGSLVMQVRHDRCLGCNECAIATVCPAEAFVRVPASRPYLLRTGE